MTVWEWPNSKVLRVIDGDTVIVELTTDMGFGGRYTRPVQLRLNRIDSYKRSTDKGLAAFHALTFLTMGEVLVKTLKGYKYMGSNYGGETVAAYMAELFTADGRNVNDELVAAGHAVLWDGAGPRPGGGTA